MAKMFNQSDYIEGHVNDYKLLDSILKSKGSAIWLEEDIETYGIDNVIHYNDESIPVEFEHLNCWNESKLPYAFPQMHFLKRKTDNYDFGLYIQTSKNRKYLAITEFDKIDTNRMNLHFHTNLSKGIVDDAIYWNGFENTYIIKSEEFSLFMYAYFEFRPYCRAMSLV